MHVLVVEDDPDARNGMLKVLACAGFTAAAAGDGVAALEEVRQRRFDAIICDLRLPHLPGAGFYEQLAGEQPDLARRVIFVSGIAYDPAVKEFLESTGQPYFGKPYDAAALIETVRRVAV